MSRYISKSKTETLDIPKTLDLAKEAVALAFLAKNRGRAIYEPTKKLGKILASRSAGKDDASKKRLSILTQRWREIVGVETAKLCQPEAINGKTLALRTNAAAALVLQMREKEILGLVSLAIGTNFNKLRFIHAPTSKATAKKLQIKPLDAHQSAQLEKKLECVQSLGLKNAIRVLNTHVQNRL
ncbi:MAG: DciA family protein [Pseudomonadota bacterium]